MTREPNMQFLSFLGSKAWAISDQGFQRLAGLARSEISIEFADFFELRPESYVTKRGTAVISIHNALVDSCPPIYEKLGIVTRYETIQQEIAEMQERGVARFVFKVNSPGGTVSGLREMGEAMLKIGQPTASYCQFACSAAYYAACSTPTIFASPSATMGNIGTILAWADVDGFWEKMGVIFKALVNDGAELKSTFHLEPDGPQLEFLQDKINRMGAEFQSHVAAARPSISPEVWQAGWYSGEQAGELGLIDGMSSFDEMLAAFEDAE
jgi:ClpP class serine protease